jgi:hypothetical protein
VNHNTAQKIQLLKETESDFEWYPTTDEILAAFSDDLYSQTETLSSINNNKEIYHDKRHYDNETETHYDFVSINSMLDVGAGDGRVFNAIKDKSRGRRFRVEKKYGIEIANTQRTQLLWFLIHIPRDISFMETSYTMMLRYFFPLPGECIRTP